MTDLAPEPPPCPIDVSKPETVAALAETEAANFLTEARYLRTVAYDIGVRGGGCSRGLDAGLDKESCLRRKEQLTLIRDARASLMAAKEFVEWAMKIDAAVPEASGADNEESDVLKRRREMLAKIAEESAA